MKSLLRMNGRVRLIATVLKTVEPKGSGGSNPSSSAITFFHKIRSCEINGGRTEMPSKVLVLLARCFIGGDSRRGKQTMVCA